MFLTHLCTKLNKHICTLLTICRTFAYAMALTTAQHVGLKELLLGSLPPQSTDMCSPEQLRKNDASNLQRQSVHESKETKEVFSYKFSIYQTTLPTMESFLLSQLCEDLSWVFIQQFAILCLVVFLSEHDLEIRISYTNHWHITSVACAEAGLNEVHFSGT